MTDTQENDYTAKRELLESRMKERELQRTSEINK